MRNLPHISFKLVASYTMYSLEMIGAYEAMVPSINLRMLAFCFAVLGLGSSFLSAVNPLLATLVDPQLKSSSRNSSKDPSSVRWKMSVSWQTSRLDCVSVGVRTLNLGANPGILRTYVSLLCQ